MKLIDEARTALSNALPSHAGWTESSALLKLRELLPKMIREIERLERELTFRDANPLECAAAHAGELTRECDVTAMCAACEVWTELSRLRRQANDYKYE